MKMRIDQALFELGFAPSKTKAQELISAGEVEFRTKNGLWRRAEKPGMSITVEEYEIRISEASDILKYVSRGGLKLEGALQGLRLNVNGFRVLDVGVSTGGFTDCLLQHGAEHVTAIDVSRNGELAEKLRRDNRVEFICRINARHLREELKVNQLFDLVVIDVSFISLSAVLPEVFDFIMPGGKLLGLIKPQFEVGQKHLNKRGIVKSSAAIEEALTRLKSEAEKARFLVCDVFKSRVKGKDGNQEYFLYAQKPKGGL